MSETNRMRAPAFQFYAADYLADEAVSLMTLEEEGAYWRAVAYCWREGSIPADDVKLSRLLKGASNQTLTVVRNCFNQMATDATRLVHPRLELEREKQRAWREKSARAGRASGKARREKKLDAEPKSNQRSNLVEPKSNTAFASASSSASSFVSTSTLALSAETAGDSVRQNSDSIFLPLANGKETAIPEKLEREFVLAYPGVDVPAEFAKVRAWLVTNPTKRKTERGIPKFLNNWMARAQNDGKRGTQHGVSPVSRADRNAAALQEFRERRRDCAAAGGVGSSAPGDGDGHSARLIQPRAREATDRGCEGGASFALSCQAS